MWSLPRLQLPENGTWKNKQKIITSSYLTYCKISNLWPLWSKRIETSNRYLGLRTHPWVTTRAPSCSKPQPQNCGHPNTASCIILTRAHPTQTCDGGQKEKPQEAAKAWERSENWRSNLKIENAATQRNLSRNTLLFSNLLSSLVPLYQPPLCSISWPRNWNECVQSRICRQEHPSILECYETIVDDYIL